jgi:hypothetical protein
MDSVKGVGFSCTKKLSKYFPFILTLDSNQGPFQTWVVKAESKNRKQK